MLHLTVEAWRLQRLQSFPQLTSHTCTGPARFTQEAHGASMGRDTIPLENMDLYSAPGSIHACAPAVRRAALPTPAGSAKLWCAWEDAFAMRNTFYFLPSCFFFFFFFFFLKRQSVLFGCLLAVWSCVMINFNGPSTTSPGNVAEQNGRYPLWKAPDRESEGWRWRDRAFRKCCFHEA